MASPQDDDLAAQRRETVSLPKFYIPASASLAEAPIRTLKQGDTFAIFDEYGDISAEEFAVLGLFHEDTRHLARCRLKLNGRKPLLLSSNVRDDNTVLEVDLTNPDIHEPDKPVLEKDTVHMHRTKFLLDGACHERIAVRNYADRAHHVEITIEFGADFADLFEVRGHKRPQRGAATLERQSEDSLILHYDGLDGIVRRTVLAFEPVPASLDLKSARYKLYLPPGGETVLFLVVQCGLQTEQEAARRTFFRRLRDMRRMQRDVMQDVTSIETSNSGFNDILCRAVGDLYMLLSPTEHGWYPYAGIPWFSAPFGRDGIITAMQTLWFDPRIAQGVLCYLAATQAAETDASADAEPGKILHETRKGEMARLGEVPFGRYYGSVDATPLFVMLAAMYLQRTGDLDTVGGLWPSIERALDWIAAYGDVDGDGFVEYRRKAESGLDNQGWKDSRDSISHADGALAEPPIALCEVQGFLYAAKKGAAEIARALGMATVAATLETEATMLRDSFEAAFWCDDIGTYALALDGAKERCRVRASNAGYSLFTGIAPRDRARSVVDSLMGPAGFSGWGIRTLAQGEARYNPMSYHNGSVWPHDNALIALGMAQYGFKEPVLAILKGLSDAAAHMELRRLPELFCGFPRKRGQEPVSYPVACAPQAWASAAMLALLQASLGLEINHAAGEIRFVRPILPVWLEDVTIRNLRLGDSAVTVGLHRHDEGVSVSVVERHGDVRVVTVQ